ncbi:hypothetical protein SLS54_008320 [Diplodia seriata]
MSRFPPHAWHGRYGGYQPPDFLDPMLAGGPPGFFDGPPMFPPPHHPFMGGPGGPPPFFAGGGGPPPGPPGDDDGPGFGGMPPGPPPHGFFPPPHGGPPPFGGGGGFMAAPWMGGPGGGPGGGPNWHFGSDNDDDGCSDGDGAANPKTLPRRPGAQGGRAGVGIIYNPKQTRLHVFRKTDIGPWKDGARRGVVVPARRMGGFNIWDADVGWSVKQLLEHLGKGDDAWAVSEVTEAGNGRWYKGSTIKYKDERAAETLSKQGWTERRGKGGGQAPVWLVLHKVE